MLDREAIFAADDIKRVPVPTPEWGGTVNVQTMTGTARDEYEQTLFGSKTGDRIKNVRATLLAFCVVDDDGKLLFRPEDIEELGGKNAAVLSRLFEAAQDVNKLTDGDVEELAGNSEADPSDDSTSD